MCKNEKEKIEDIKKLTEDIKKRREHIEKSSKELIKYLDSLTEDEENRKN